MKELNQWVSAVRKILPSDTGREKCKKYHRGIYDGDVWNCCKRRCKRGESSMVFFIYKKIQSTRKSCLSRTSQPSEFCKIPSPKMLERAFQGL